MENIPTWRLVVAGAIQRSDGCWLMHRRPDSKHHGGLWEFPGGKVEIGENPPVTLARELCEELGIEIDQAETTPVTFAHEPVDSGDVPIVILLYKVTSWVGTPLAREGGKIGWFTPGEIKELSKPPLDLLLMRGLFTELGV